MKSRFFWSLALALFSACPCQAIPITLNNLGGAAPGTVAGDAFLMAAQRVGSLFSNPISIFINVAFTNLAGGVLGDTQVTQYGLSYSSIRSGLIANANPFSPVDMQALANLPSGPLDFRTNQSNGSVIRDNDNSNNNNFLAIAQANARALGLFPGNDPTVDATIRFNNAISWDFDPSDGITPGTFDFVGVATHEMIHALGFVSGVDIVDVTSGSGPSAPLDLNALAVSSVLDLYRYSPQSLAMGPGVLDLAVGGTPYFSLDGGTTSLGLFSTGAFQGDGRQASHWKDGLNLGIMDPTFAPGELGVLRPLDVNALDAIGFNLSSQGAPELDPGKASGTLVFVLIGLQIRRRRPITG